MSAGLAVLLLAVGLALCLLLAHAEHKLYLRRKAASPLLRAEAERRAREKNVTVIYGGRRLPR